MHAFCQLDKPAVGPRLPVVRHGYAHQYTDAHDGLRHKRVPLPAAALLGMVRVGRAATDVALRRRMAGLVMTALTFARLGGGANRRPQDLTLMPTSMVIQIADYKHGARANRERVVIRIPRRATGAPGAACELVRDHVAALIVAKAAPDQLLFTPLGDHTALPTEVAIAWMRERLFLTHVCAPAGSLYSGHSLRGGAATSARSVGCSLDAIATLMGMRNKSTTTMIHRRS